MKNQVSKIVSGKLLLRTFDQNDAYELQDFLARNKTHMLPWISWAANEPQSIIEKQNQIRRWRGEFYLDQKYVYGVFSKKDQKLIGIQFLLTRQGVGILEIGYIIDHEQNGKGYATQSTYAMLKLCFEHINIAKSVIHCNQDNIASTKIPVKLNFLLEGIRKEAGSPEHMMIWSMSKDDFIHNPKLEPTSFHENIPLDFMNEKFSN